MKKPLGRLVTVIGNTLLLTVMSVLVAGLAFCLYHLYGLDRFEFWVCVGFLGTVITGIVCLDLGRWLQRKDKW